MVESECCQEGYLENLFFKNSTFCPLGGLTKVLFSAIMLTIVLFCGRKWMLTKVLIVVPSVALDM